jgi:trehalose 6-phosphate phosphatase
VLAPLVLNPLDARAIEGTVEVLDALAGLPDTHAAVVSGRDLDTLTRLTDLPKSSPVTRIGSHGAESSAVADPQPALDPARESTLRALTDELAEVVASHPGARLEHKPTATVLHTRGQTAEDAEAAVTAALEVAARHTGVSVLEGKSVVELRVVEADKGSSLMALKAGLGADRLAYFGDDVTDEHVFEVMGEQDVSIKVGAGDTLARFRVGGPEDVAETLFALLDLRRAHRP